MSMRSKRKGGRSGGGGGGGSSNAAGSSKKKRSATRIDFAAAVDSDDDNYDHDDHLHSDEESSGQEMSDGRGRSDDEEESDEEEKETVDAKKIRLARQYLNKMERRVGRGRRREDEIGGGSGEASSSEEESSDDDEDNADEAAAMTTMGPSPHDKLGAALARQRQKREGTLRRRLATKTRASIASMWVGKTSSTTTTSNDAIADFQSFVNDGIVTLHRGHDLTATAVALHQPSGSTAYSGSKDNSVFMWDVERGMKTATICPQWKRSQKQQSSGGKVDNDNDNNSSSNKSKHRADGEVLALAASDDGRYLAAGHRDATIKIFDVRMAGKGGSGASGGAASSAITTFRGHKGPVTSLCFRPNTLQLFTASEDRCLRHYNLEEMAYVETLYGHQAGVSAVTCSRRERPVSAGRDRTVRSWKLAEETHLIYRPGGRVSSADCIGAVDDNWFLSGHDDGNLSLWTVDKKRPVDTVTSAHGLTEASLSRGITALDVLPSSDVAVTGSADGYARFWSVKTDYGEERGLESLGRVPMHGYVNDMALGPRARFCVAAIGQEPRLGRWDRVRKAKNRFAIVRLRKEDEDDDDEDEAGEGDMVIDDLEEAAGDVSSQEESSEDDGSSG